MLLSHNFSFLYLKTTRTASTSTEVFLQEASGLPFKGHPLGGHRQVIDPRGIVGSRGQGVCSSDSFRNHMAPSEIRPLVGDKVWGLTTRLANIRNPFDSFISRVWFWSQIGRFELSREGSLTRVDVDRALDGWGRAKVEHEILCNDSELRAQCIIRFENLEHDLSSICRDLGMPHDTANLSKSRTPARPPRTRDYQSLFSSSSKRKIESQYVDWIEFGQYRF